MLRKPAAAPALFPSQRASIRQVVHCFRHGAVVGTGTARGVLLADEQGTGKTPVSIVAANAMRFQRILVVCPASLRTVWDDAIRLWQTLKHPIYHLNADNIGLYSPNFLSSLRCGWVIINYDIAHRYPGLKDAPWDLLICDEAIALKSHQAQRTAAVFGGKYRGKNAEAIQVSKYLLLSGTPIPNRIEEIVTLIEVLDPDNWSFMRFVQDFFKDADADHARRIQGEVRDLHILQHKLRTTVMVRCLKDDVIALPPKTYETAAVPLPSFLEEEFSSKHRARRILLAKLRGSPPKRLREALQQQLTGLHENMAWAAGACSFKIDAVVDYLLRQTEKVVVFAHHRDVIEEYGKRLRQAGRGVVTLTGRNTKQAGRVVKQFQTDPDIQYFLGNMKVAGQGITLTAAALVVFAEFDWSPAAMGQAEDGYIGSVRHVTCASSTLCLRAALT
jgi:SWI/SNF-related matrix-associated actin-dependent regulator 1 of chromatin subfamily A